MPFGIVYQFQKVTRADFNRVNGIMGIDQEAASPDWPPGLISHTAGLAPNGGLVVTEVWESAQAQSQFMSTRLGPAIAKGGVTEAPQLTPFEVFSYHTPGKLAPK
jgi:hypothetical protein